jgi:hypothetical protein
MFFLIRPCAGAKAIASAFQLIDQEVILGRGNIVIAQSVDRLRPKTALSPIPKYCKGRHNRGH